MLIKPYSEQLKSIPNRYKLGFFDILNKAIYEGKTASQLRRELNLPVIEYRERISSPIIDIPYWEIHFYEGGFNRMGLDSGLVKALFSQSNQEFHFYFTLKKLIPKGFEYRDSFNNIVDVNSKNWGQIHVGGDNCKIDKNYSGSKEDQIYPAETIYVIDDNFDFLEQKNKPIPYNKQLAIFKSFKFDEMPGVKPSDLPQMMFFAPNCRFAAKSENTDSILCMDDNSALYAHKVDPTEETVLRLKGNAFINGSAFVSINNPSGKNYLGKNTIIGYDASVTSSVIGDNVFVGSYCNLDIDTEIGFNAFISDYIKIIEGQSIPAYQNITTKVPAFMNLLKYQRGFYLKDFNRITKNK